MRRITLWALSTLTTLALLFSYHTSRGDGSTTAATVAQAPVVAGSSSGSSGSSSGDSSSGSSSGDSSGSSSGSSSSGSSSSTSSGSYTGDSVDTRWGPVQVRITVRDGTIVSSQAVVHPTNNPRDVEINNYALPVLDQEAVDAQSASIDMVSGATVTSEGYLQSLQSAIDQAHL